MVERMDQVDENQPGPSAPLFLEPRFWSLTGLNSYAEVQELQRKLLDLRAQDKIPDTILFLEHHPVITRGRGLQWTGQPREKHMPAPAFLPEGTEFCESERGGDLTWHGPGQLVMYPICKLNGATSLTPSRDIGSFLRGQESLLCEVLSRDFSCLTARTRENATGVWVGSDEAPRKIASIGVAVRRWVIWHGIAINLTNSLEPFHLISPCGFQPEVMTSLSACACDGTASASKAKSRDQFEAAWREGWCRRAGIAPEKVMMRRLTLAEAFQEVQDE